MYNNNNNQANNEIRYTDMNMKRCLTKDGSPYIGVTLKSVVTKANQPRRVGNRLVSEFTMPINGKSKYIETMCGMAPYESNGAVWAKVSFWQDSDATDGPVTRLDKLFQQTSGKGVVLVVTGSIKVEQNTAKDGRIFVNTNINGDDFLVVSPAEEKPNGRYSFMNMKRCTGKNGNPYVGVTAELAVFDTERRETKTGKSVVGFRATIRGRSKYIESMCGMAPYTNDKGLSRVSVAFWEDPGEERSIGSRLEHLLEKNPGKNFVLAVTGAIKVDQRKDDKGNVFVDAKITGDSFSVIRSFEKQQAGGYGESGQQSQDHDQQPQQATQGQGYGQPAQQARQSQNSGRPEQESIPSGFGTDFVDITDEDDDELPF